jgi:hypothetical protein
MVSGFFLFFFLLCSYLYDVIFVFSLSLFNFLVLSPCSYFLSLYPLFLLAIPLCVRPLSHTPAFLRGPLMLSVVVPICGIAVRNWRAHVRTSRPHGQRDQPSSLTPEFQSSLCWLSFHLSHFVTEVPYLMSPCVTSAHLLMAPIYYSGPEHVHSTRTFISDASCHHPWVLFPCEATNSASSRSHGNSLRCVQLVYFSWTCGRRVSLG